MWPSNTLKTLWRAIGGNRKSGSKEIIEGTIIVIETGNCVTLDQGYREVDKDEVLIFKYFGNSADRTYWRVRYRVWGKVWDTVDTVSSMFGSEELVPGGAI